MADLVTIAEASSRLGVRPGTLRRLCREGMPHTPGHRGRGLKTLVDPADVLLFLDAPCDDRVLLAVADDLPRVLAGAVHEIWQTAEGIDKRRLAGILAATWYQCAVSTLDRLREQSPGIADIKKPPSQIEYLAKIARDK